jgi:membrane-associated phospholipid phosphatase
MSELSLTKPIDRAPMPDWQRNFWVALAALIVLASLYHTTAIMTDPALGSVLMTQLDRSIPFVPASAYAYAAVYTVMFFPAFVIRSADLYRRTIIAYAATVVISVTIFLSFPVTAIGLRPDLSNIDLGVFHNWGMRLIYTVDPPTNLCPSLHLSTATVAALAAWRAKPAYGMIAATLALGIAVSILTTKQHYIVDGFAGLALGFTVVGIVFRGYESDAESEAERIFGWGAVARFGVFHCTLYLVPLALFLVGFRPWEW